MDAVPADAARPPTAPRGRPAMVARLVAALGPPGPPAPVVLVGRRGSGRSVLLELLGRDLVRLQVAAGGPAPTVTLIPGSELLRALRRGAPPEDVLLLVDDAAPVLRAGLLPADAAGALVLTPEERDALAETGSLPEGRIEVDVEPPEPELAEIAACAAGALAAHHGVELDPGVIDRALEVARTTSPESSALGAALDLLDELAAERIMAVRAGTESPAPLSPGDLEVSNRVRAMTEPVEAVGA